MTAKIMIRESVQLIRVILTGSDFSNSCDYANINITNSDAGRERMQIDKKKLLLMMPLIILVLLHIPAMVANTIPEIRLQGMPELIWNTYVVLLSVAMLIWCMLFLYIPLPVFILIIMLYTGFSWLIRMRKTKWDIKYCIVWIALCIVLILMYWKFGWLYNSMISR